MSTVGCRCKWTLTQLDLEQTDTHTDTQDKYRNPRACAPRVMIIMRLSLWRSDCYSGSVQTMLRVLSLSLRGGGGELRQLVVAAVGLSKLFELSQVPLLQGLLPLQSDVLQFRALLKDLQQ